MTNQAQGPAQGETTVAETTTRPEWANAIPEPPSAAVVGQQSGDEFCGNGRPRDASGVTGADSLAADEAGAATGEDLAAQLDAARAEIAVHRDRYLRLQAEMENERRRMNKELDKARRFAIQEFAEALLGVRDSLELGAAAAQETEDANKIREGTELTLKMLVQVMEKFGIACVDPLGQRFNPDSHQAMGTQESASHEPNTVVQVVQKGYCLHERLLRPALVMVARRPSSNHGDANSDSQ